MIFNLTQHSPTPDQIEAGVISNRDHEQEIQSLLTFDHGNFTLEELKRRAKRLAEIALESGENEAMIGGAGWLMPPLERALVKVGICPMYAFSVRESVEQEMPDGSVRKVNKFRHVNFIIGSEWENRNQ